MLLIKSSNESEDKESQNEFPSHLSGSCPRRKFSQFILYSLVLNVFFFFMQTIYEVFIDLLQYCPGFMVWFFNHEVCGVLAPLPGIKPAPPALEGEVLSTGLPGKFHTLQSLNSNCLK